MRLIICLTGLALAAGLFSPGYALAADPSTTIYQVTPEGIGKAVGSVRVIKSSVGAVFSVTAKDLPPGSHGLGLHENGACGPGTIDGKPEAAGAAGPSWTPTTDDAHPGGLPALEILPDGTAVKLLTAPSIKDVETVRGHALVILAAGDSAVRIACGVLK